MPLRVVPEVDYARYAGRWYEIARLPNWFEQDCASDITAEYTLRADGRLAVVNRCRKANGATREAKGVARRVDGQPPSVLKVRFAPGFLSWLPQVWGDYQMIALAPDYSTVVVGSPDRKYLWILARTPRLDDQVYQRLLDEGRSQAFDVARILKVQQAAR
jgi:apolipoprotein D and lipocalin family protein